MPPDAPKESTKLGSCRYSGLSRSSSHAMAAQTWSESRRIPRRRRSRRTARTERLATHYASACQQNIGQGGPTGLGKLLSLGALAAFGSQYRDPRHQTHMHAGDCQQVGSANCLHLSCCSWLSISRSPSTKARAKAGSRRLPMILSRIFPRTAVKRLTSALGSMEYSSG